jgi:hypothetical protein
MSAEPLIRELFRGLETTIHERLGMIEQILHSVEKPKVPLYDNEFISRIERLERLVATQNPLQNLNDNSLLEERVTALEENLASLFSDVERMKESAPSPILPMRTHTVDMLLSGDEKIIDEEPVIEVVENVQEEEIVEEEEEEEKELALEEFEYKGKTYYKDEENQVYEMDEEGDISEPIGSWNGKRIIPFSH